MGETGEIRRGAKPLAGAVIGAGCGLSSISFYTNSIFVSAIHNDLGWSVGQLQFGVTVMILMAVITAPVVGGLIDRYTSRRVALVSIPLYGLSLAAFSLTTDEILSYYLLWTSMALLGAGTLPITWTRLVNLWFDRHRGIALGITLAGTGIAATVAPPYVAWLIEELGWRGAYLALAITVTAIALPGVYAFFREPASRDMQANLTQPADVRNVSLAIALRSYRFWALAVGLLLVAAGISGLITNLVPLLVHKGISAGTAASYAGLIGISVIVGRLLAGYLVDRIWAPLVAAFFLSAPAVAAFALSAETLSPAMLAVSALIIGLAAGAELDLFAFLASRYFGLQHYGAIYGALYMFFSVGAGLAPVGFGVAFDVFGNYGPVLYLVAVMSILGGALMLTLGRYSKDGS